MSKPKKKTASSSAKSGGAEKARATLRNWLQLAQLRYEKCELAEARVAYHMALKCGERVGDLRATMEAIAGLLRLAADALNEGDMRAWDAELDRLMKAHSRQIPPMAWYCKGIVARRAGDMRLAQRHVHRYLRAVREEARDPGREITTAGLVTPEEALAKGWVSLATIQWQKGHGRRARWMCEQMLSRYESSSLRGVNGLVYLLQGNVAEGRRDYDSALQWYQKAHASFLSEHNWYYHLFVLYGYARVYRHQQNYKLAYWHLDLLDKATPGEEFGMLKREIASERSRLEQDAVDLLIDSRRAVIRTRESGQISLRKQYVLLHILEALSQAHGKPGEDIERGLSKAEIIERVWKENYRPEAHDNKLYYNINRLRKLIEPDVRKPRYLLNWKEGYRLAPGLRVQLLAGRTAEDFGEGKNK